MRAAVFTALILCYAPLAPVLAQDSQPAARVKTWGATLNPGGYAPTGSFKAFYLDTNQPQHVIASESVADISINYAWSDFHGIKSEDFGAYWVGWMEFDRDAARTIELSLSWSKARVVIDGQVVYEGSDNARQPFTFTKGRHLVEVEYVNNWHTTSFRAAFKPANPLLSSEEIVVRLLAAKLDDAEVHFVGLYESLAKDLSVRVDVAPSSKPLILVLSSYDAINWVFHEAQPGTVRAVVYNSHNPGSAVVIGRGVLLLPSAARIGTYELQRRCSCVAGIFHCEGQDNLISTIVAIERLTGIRPASFNGQYNADQVSIPGTAVTADLENRVRASAADEKLAQQQCARAGNPDFDKMFDQKTGETNNSR